LVHHKAALKRARQKKQEVAFRQMQHLFL